MQNIKLSFFLIYWTKFSCFPESLILLISYLPIDFVLFIHYVGFASFMAYIKIINPNTFSNV